MNDNLTKTSTEKLSLAPKLVLVAALLLTPIYFFGIRMPVLSSSTPLLHLLGIVAGIGGFLGLLIWNALLAKKSFIAANTFLTIWMFLYFSLTLFLKG